MSDDKDPLAWLLRDPYTEARVFYGKSAFEAIAKQEREASKSWRRALDAINTAPLSVMDYTKSRTRFAWFPVKLWSGRYQRCGGGWLCWVREYWTDGEWKAFRIKDAP